MYKHKFSLWQQPPSLISGCHKIIFWLLITIANDYSVFNNLIVMYMIVCPVVHNVASYRPR